MLYRQQAGAQLSLEHHGIKEAWRSAADRQGRSLRGRCFRDQRNQATGAGNFSPINGVARQLGRAIPSLQIVAEYAQIAGGQLSNSTARWTAALEGLDVLIGLSYGLKAGIGRDGRGLGAGGHLGLTRALSW